MHTTSHSDFCVRDGNGSRFPNQVEDRRLVRSIEVACPRLDRGNAESKRRNALTARPDDRKEISKRPPNNHQCPIVFKKV